MSAYETDFVQKRVKNPVNKKQFNRLNEKPLARLKTAFFHKVMK